MKSTKLLLEQDGSKPDNNRTYRYTPVPRKEPSSHGSMVYGETPPTYNNPNMQQPLCHSVTTIPGSCNVVHGGQPLYMMYNTFHIYGICLKRNRKINSLCNFAQSDSQNGNMIILPLREVGWNRHLNDILFKRSFWPSDSIDKFVDWFLKRQFVPLWSAIVKSFAF